MTWRSKKQVLVARSSVKAEFRAMARGICEVIWPMRLLTKLKIVSEEPIKLNCDNKATISIAHNHVHDYLTKHVEIEKTLYKGENGREDCHDYLPSTSQQTMDVLTKDCLDKGLSS